MIYLFDNVPFHVQTPDGFVPRFVSQLAHSIEHIPYSDSDVVDVGGKQSPTVRCPVICLSHEFTDFEAKLGVTGELIYGPLTVQATLTEISNIRQNFDGTHFFMDCVFVQVT